MIIFDLDGTLADCEHRRHYVDKKLNADNEKWKPNWKAFFEACDKDKPIVPVMQQLRYLSVMDTEIEIWSGRDESVRDKTEHWLAKHYLSPEIFPYKLKMRPQGDNTPDDKLKEGWLDEAIHLGKEVGYVFDDRPKVVRMWRRRGIFVFNCCQHEREF